MTTLSTHFGHLIWCLWSVSCCSRKLSGLLKSSVMEYSPNMSCLLNVFWLNYPHTVQFIVTKVCWLFLCLDQCSVLTPCWLQIDSPQCLYSVQLLGCVKHITERFQWKPDIQASSLNWTLEHLPFRDSQIYWDGVMGSLCDVLACVRRKHDTCIL